MHYLYSVACAWMPEEAYLKKTLCADPQDYKRYSGASPEYREYASRESCITAADVLHVSDTTSAPPRASVPPWRAYRAAETACVARSAGLRSCLRPCAGPLSVSPLVTRLSQ